jgi:hypothetical protein
MMKLMMLNHTEALANQPRRCKLRILPKRIPTAMKIVMQTMKQIFSLASWDMIVPFPRISTQTVMNCCRDWATLMKWRAQGPYTRK